MIITPIVFAPLALGCTTTQNLQAHRVCSSVRRQLMNSVCWERPQEEPGSVTETSWEGTDSEKSWEALCTAKWRLCGSLTQQQQKKIKWSSPSKQRPEREVRKNRNQGWKDNVAARFKLACKGYSARKVHTWSPCCWEDGLQVWLMSTLGRLEAIMITQSQWFGFHESKNLKSSTKDCRKFDNSLLVTLTRVWDILSLP